jgi:alpha-mannosidase
MTAEETNLMEKSIGPLKLRNETVTVPTKLFEIKTVKVEFPGSPNAQTVATK